MIPLACGGRDAYLTPMNTTETPLFKLRTEYVPTGDQPAAIEQLASNIEAGVKDQVLLGVTGSGKTFTVANVIAQVNRPALVLAPNKTLAAQLYNEFRALFPENAVEYFVSYYDYYQPEAYVPASDTYIEKDSAINDDIDKLRHAATHALLTRRDVIIVASVSCIYGLGSRGILCPFDHYAVRRSASVSAWTQSSPSLWMFSTNAMIWIFTGERSGFGATCWK